MGKTKEKALLAMSGGVDSSVAAHLLLRAGYDVTGVFLCLAGAVGSDHDTSGCCSPGDAADARRVADRLGIDLFVLDAGPSFERIIEYFLDEYARGRTPNPCIHCNTLVKFARLIARADALGARYVASGHHARMDGGRIRRAPDKDQSYALFGIAREHLERILLPIGEVADKAAVRRIAADLDLPVAEKPDSQEICFVSDSYVELLARRRPEALRPGNIVDGRGNVLGRHEGIGRFTVGQRRGLRVAAGVPLYVTKIDAASATVTVGAREEALCPRLSADRANWHADPPAEGSEFDAVVQVRYNHAGAPGKVRVLAAGRFEVDFDEPVLAVTPGQAAAVYLGDTLLGGGWIE